jgi:hypothetical protein
LGELFVLYSNTRVEIDIANFFKQEKKRGNIFYVDEDKMGHEVSESGGR